MKFTPLEIPEIILIEPSIFEDERGFFLEAYDKRKFLAGGVKLKFVQENHSGSEQGVLRGMHYQRKFVQGKLIRVIAGEVFDVAVDVRKSSPTFKSWVGVRLSQKNKHQLWIPPGFAHGFYVLSAWAEVVYKVTNYYAPQWERSFCWNDPAVGINWPILPGSSPILSEKDSKAPGFFSTDLLP